MFVFVFVFFHYFQKCTLYFCIFFGIFPFLHRLHFVPLYFSFFRHAVKEQNRESTNAWLYFFIFWVCILYFNDYRVNSL